MDEKELLRRLKSGDRDTQKKFWELHRDPIYGFIYARSRLKRANDEEVGKSKADDSDVQDILVSTFVSFFKDIAKFRGTNATMKTWLYGIAKNRIIDFYREEDRQSFGRSTSAHNQAETKKEVRPEELEAFVRRLAVELRLQPTDIHPEEELELADAVGIQQGRVISRDQILREKLQTLARLDDLGNLRSYLVKTASQRANLIVDEENKTPFENLARALGDGRVDVSPKKHLFIDGNLNRATFEETLADLNRRRELDGSIFVLPKALVSEFSASKGLPGSLLYRVN